MAQGAIVETAEIDGRPGKVERQVLEDRSARRGTGVRMHCFGHEVAPSGRSIEFSPSAPADRKLAFLGLASRLVLEHDVEGFRREQKVRGGAGRRRGRAWSLMGSASA